MFDCAKKDILSAHLIAFAIWCAWNTPGIGMFLWIDLFKRDAPREPHALRRHFHAASPNEAGR